jgi:Na+-driven multidrug efflux pump
VFFSWLNHFGYDTIAEIVGIIYYVTSDHTERRMTVNTAGKNDFSKGSIIKNILDLAFPMILAQVINVLYNIVDRIYIGMMPENAMLSMTGLGLTLPIITIVIAFANLFGMGGAPLCSIARGRGDDEEAERIMGNSFVLLLISGVLLTLLGLAFKTPCCIYLEPVLQPFLLLMIISLYIC